MNNKEIDGSKATNEARRPSVLMLSPFFHPEKISTGKYNTFLARQLARDAGSVRVLASHPLYPDWQPLKSDAGLAGVTIMRGGARVRYPQAPLLRRAVLELWYGWFVCSRYIRIRRSADIIVPVFPPSLFFFLMSPLLPSASRSVGLVHDLQGVYAGHSTKLGGRLVHKLIHFIEKRCFSACDSLIFLSKTMQERAVSEYDLNRSRCAVCYPFVALDHATVDSGSALKDLFDADKISVVYSGALGDKQNPDGLYAFFQALLARQRDVECHVFSAGPHYERIRTLADTAGSAIRFHALVDGKHLDELYARSDIQIIPQASGTSEGSLPSKLPNLMAAGVPVFVISDFGSELASLVKQARAGHAAFVWDAAKLVDEFEHLRSLLKKEPREARRKRLRHFVETHFSVQNVVDEILRHR